MTESQSEKKKTFSYSFSDFELFINRQSFTEGDGTVILLKISMMLNPWENVNTFETWKKYIYKQL